jgi:hypothetical protein
MSTDGWNELAIDVSAVATIARIMWSLMAASFLAGLGAGCAGMFAFQKNRALSRMKHSA